ncbi:uncharacterized protein TNCV_1796791 [Trichonephila clavipes]|nr:uncharacterized protein TNCV_1796791 [Trichonephila clavipes]
MPSHMLQRLFETSVQPNTSIFFLGLLIRGDMLPMSTCRIWLVGVSLVIRVLQLQKDELLLRLQAIWNYLSKADIHNLFDSMSRRVAALIAARGGCTKY